jgi:formylglycine-generating enzyme required for sulfatase activity
MDVQGAQPLRQGCTRLAARPVPARDERKGANLEQLDSGEAAGAPSPPQQLRIPWHGPCLLILVMVLVGAHAAEGERNSLGMAFVKLPAGEFLMGSDEAPESLARAYPQFATRPFAQLDDEGPVHSVRITRPR